MQVNISKKELIVFAAAFVLIASIFSVTAALTGAWHPLQQVSTDFTGSISVDADANGKVDDADRIGGLSSSQLLAAGGGGLSSITIAFPKPSEGCPALFGTMQGNAIGIDGGSAFTGNTATPKSTSSKTLAANLGSPNQEWCVRQGLVSAQAYSFSSTQSGSATCAPGFTKVHASTNPSGAYTITYTTVQNSENGIILGLPISCAGSCTGITTGAVSATDTTTLTTAHTSGGASSDPGIVHCLKVA